VVAVGVAVVSAWSFEQRPMERTIRTRSARVIPGTIATLRESVLWVAPASRADPR